MHIFFREQGFLSNYSGKWNIKYINANHNVTSKRKLLYKGNNKRPYSIEVTLIVDGKKIEFKPNPITI